MYECRAYALKRHIWKKQKLDARADIGYLMGYDSSNIFLIWLSGKNKIIATRDVQFNETRVYNPDDIDANVRARDQIESQLEVLQLSIGSGVDQKEMSFIYERPRRPTGVYEYY